jgi:Uma2 family endonuclease
VWIETQTGDEKIELIAGQIVVHSPDFYCSVIAAQITYRLVGFVINDNRSYVTGEGGGYCIGNERYVPDGAYISKVRQPKLARKGYNPNPPELAVEVMSPTDNERQLLLKVGNYLSVGTTVWVVYPDTQEVDVFQPGQPTRSLTTNDTLTVEHLLPGFALPVRDIFPNEESA